MKNAWKASGRNRNCSKAHWSMMKALGNCVHIKLEKNLHRAKSWRKRNTWNESVTNRNCSKVHWSKQVRCRRLATGRAGRLWLAANTPLPLLPIHLDFILHKDLQKCFIFVFLCLHFYISASSSSDGV